MKINLKKKKKKKKKKEQASVSLGGHLLKYCYYKRPVFIMLLWSTQKEV